MNVARQYVGTHLLKQNLLFGGAGDSAVVKVHDSVLSQSPHGPQNITRCKAGLSPKHPCVILGNPEPKQHPRFLGPCTEPMVFVAHSLVFQLNFLACSSNRHKCTIYGVELSPNYLFVEKFVLCHFILPALLSKIR